MSTLSSRAAWAAGTALAAAGGVALAGAAGTTVPLNQPVTVSGTLTLAWQGDQARGCAKRGLCSERGSITVHFDGYGTLTGASTGRRDELQLESASATARVRREDPGAQPGECVDVVATDSLAVSLRRGAGRRYTAALDAGSLSSGRCAGPLRGELARLPLAAMRLPGRLPGFDLRGVTPFAAGPFSGVLVSTMKLVPEPGMSSSTSTSGDSSTSGSGPAPRPRRVHVLREYADVRYRLTGPMGSLGVSFSGVPAPECEPADSCGVSGRATLSPAGINRVVEIQGQRTVRVRASPRQALADLRAGRLDTSGTFLTAPLGATVSESLVRAGGAGCHDTLGRALMFDLNALPPASRVLIPADLDAYQPFRTHCPGPVDSAAFGNAPVATGQLSLAAVARGPLTLTLTLTRSGGFDTGGYSATRFGAVSFRLQPLSRRAGTRTVTEVVQ